MTNPSWDFSTTSDEVAETLSDYIKDKTVLVTGISPDGLGLDFCRAISAHAPSLIILAARNPSKIAAAEEYLLSINPSLKLKTLIIDLTSFASVRSAADEVNSSIQKLDVLVNNAAMHASTLKRTEDGIESSFATNHLGHFLFTNLLLRGAMKGGGRVVNVTSNSFRRGAVLWDDPNFLNTSFGEGWEAYSQSKTSNVLFSSALADRFGSKGIYSYSLHPGLNVTLHWKSFAQGTATHVVAAFDPSIEPQNGGFLTDCQIKPIVGDEAAWATGKENYDRLWKLSEELVGETFV
ncbi:hypothetical protein ABW19_dt0206849 [Dactylella cylindrospora]|nr:hypothetical protein ABW19_dt0206849 [Dactylella cylindrospora]